MVDAKHVLFSDHVGVDDGAQAGTLIVRGPKVEYEIDDEDAVNENVEHPQPLWNDVDETAASA